MPKTTATKERAEQRRQARRTTPAGATFADIIARLEATPQTGEFTPRCCICDKPSDGFPAGFGRIPYVSPEARERRCAYIHLACTDGLSVRMKNRLRDKAGLHLACADKIINLECDDSDSTDSDSDSDTDSDADTVTDVDVAAAAVANAKMLVRGAEMLADKCSRRRHEVESLVLGAESLARTCKVLQGAVAARVAGSSTGSSSEKDQAELAMLQGLLRTAEEKRDAAVLAARKEIELSRAALAGLKSHLATAAASVTTASASVTIASAPVTTAAPAAPAPEDPAAIEYILISDDDEDDEVEVVVIND